MMIFKKKDKIYFFWKKKKILIVFVLVCVFVLMFYYWLLFQNNKGDLIFNKYMLNQVSSREIPESLKEKDKIIKRLQTQVKNIFNTLGEKPTFDIKPYMFYKGQTVYAFSLDIENNMCPFQEGIISQNYNLDSNDYLFVSLKGKNNKIFFNTKGEFIGISAPDQDDLSEINHVITSNSFYSLSQCESFDDDQKITNDYYFRIQSDEGKKNKIFLDKKGLLLGFYNNPKPNKLDFWDYLFKRLCKQNIITQYAQDYKIDNVLNTQMSQIKNLDQISLLIALTRGNDNELLSLGSGFIYKIEQINNKSYKYYVLTNRHVISSYNDKINKLIFQLYHNEEIKQGDLDLLGTIDNSDIYDDIAVLTFEDEDQDQFDRIKTILDKVFPDKKIDIYPGQTVYSMGSQISDIPEEHLTFNLNSYNQHLYNLHSRKLIEVNLLKKGNVVNSNAKEIFFDIQIDRGNSGGPVFNTEGEIIGMNKSIILSVDTLKDRISQCIYIEHIKTKFDEIIESAENKRKKLSDKSTPIKLDKTDIFWDSIQNQKLVIDSFNRQNISILFKDLLSRLKNAPGHSISSNILQYPQDIQLKIDLIMAIYGQRQVFVFNPNKETIKISYDQKNDKIIFCKNGTDYSVESKEFDVKAINDLEVKEPFFSLELNYPYLSKNDNNAKKQKIKNSLVFFENNKEIEGSGIIFQKQKLSNNKFLYFVLSTYIHKNGFLDATIESVKNIFARGVELIFCHNGKYIKEKGEIRTFLSHNDLILITFESSDDYDVVLNRSTEDLKLGEEIFFLINSEYDSYYPQMFKSIVSYKDKDIFLCDSVFDLNHKKIKFNLFYFDRDGHFIGINKKNNNLSSYFSSVSLPKELDILNLLNESQFNIFLPFIFHFMFFITFVLVIILIFENNPLKVKKP